MISALFSRTALNVLGAVLLLVLAACGAGSAWYLADRSTAARQAEILERASELLTGLAAAYAEQLSRQILALDQTLEFMAKEWEADPKLFNLEASRARSKILTGVAQDMFLADETGSIRQASIPDFIGQNVGGLDIFRDAAEHAKNTPAVRLGAAAVNPMMRQWHIDAARTLLNPDGSFAGLIDADYRVSAITGIFQRTSPPGNGFVALIGLNDGKIRATSGSTVPTPDTGIADTPMFSAIDGPESGTWTGPSAIDAVVRLHAFRRLPDSDLVVVAGVDRRETLLPAAIWAEQSQLFAAAISGLAALILIVVYAVMIAAHWRRARSLEMNAQLASAQALAEVARADVDTVARRLQATFDSLSDGIAIFDAHLNLVEWNGLFPERAGVNASFFRTGTPMEDVLRTQAQAGYFGESVDVEQEVERRAALLRAGNFGASQSFVADGNIIELRCRPLPEGGFVSLYTNISERLKARQDLRDARIALEQDRAANNRFLGAIAFELRSRAARLLNANARLRTIDLPPAARQDVAQTGRAAEEVDELAGDTVDVPLMEAGALTARPEMTAVKPLLQDVVEALQSPAEAKAITLYLVINDQAPAELITDPARLRRIVSLLLTEAMRLAAPGAMWLLADGGGGDPGLALKLTIRSFGVPLADDVRAGLFPDFSTVAAPPPDDAARGAGTGLGPAIARHLALLLGGSPWCETWATADGRTGNDLILALPTDLLPGRNGRAPGAAFLTGRPAPRTRVLMVGPRTGLRAAAATMLRRDGHMVDDVSSGAEAIQLLRTAPYDIVFADTILPDMAIEAAVNEMRDLLGPARMTPVVAIAPPHREAEEKSWLDNGIDAILTAPPTLRDLADAIEDHVWQTHGAETGVEYIAAWREDSEEGIPVLSSARVAELRSNIPADDLREMVEECIADLFHRVPALRRSLAAEAYGAITAHAHAMAGMAGGYGMSVLEARLRAILSAVRNRRLDTIDFAADVVHADLTRGAAALRRALRRIQHTAAETQTHEGDQAGIESAARDDL